MKSNILGYNDYDFDPIYKAIKTYYPIEVAGDNFDPSLIKEYPGFIEIGNILNDNFFIRKNYRERWVGFKKFLRHEMKRPVTETMVAYFPCYSGFVTIEKIKNDGYTKTKELHYSISLLGKFYSIYGLDKSEIAIDEVDRLKNNGEKRSLSYPAYHCITVSPHLEYEEHFRLLKEKIMEYFPTYSFVPFKINMTKISGISYYTPDIREEFRDTIYSALFSSNMNFDIPVRGDTYFGFDEWSKVKGIDLGKLQKAKEKIFLNASLINKDEVSIHKVWKLKSISRIYLPPENENLMFGMDSFDLLDLTNETSATIITNDRKEPFFSLYDVVADQVKFLNFNDKVLLKISRLNLNELALVLNINIETDGGKKIHGDLVEMFFETI